MADRSAGHHRLQAEDGADRDGRGRHPDPPVGQLRHHPDGRRGQERLQRGCKTFCRLEFSWEWGVVWEWRAYGTLESLGRLWRVW